MAKSASSTSKSAGTTKSSSGKPAAKSPNTRKSNSTYRLLTWGGIALVAIGVLVGLTLLVRSNVALANAPGERIPIQGADHIPDGQQVSNYNSDPPTSGPHYASPIPAGFYDAPQEDEYVVHNLEHGHIVISYDCSKLSDCEAVKSQLRDLSNSYRNWKVTIIPRENRDAAIGVAAWGWLDKLDAYDESRIRQFIDAWRDKGPEKTME
jgi:hypothetical protein